MSLVSAMKGPLIEEVKILYAEYFVFTFVFIYTYDEFIAYGLSKSD